jgi:hypothetical protein
MRLLAAVIFSACAALAHGQSTSDSDTTQASPLPTRLAEQPSAVLLLAQSDPADKKTFECKCTDAVDKTKTDTKTCNKGQTCSCNSGKASCK